VIAEVASFCAQRGNAQFNLSSSELCSGFSLDISARFGGVNFG